MQKQPSAHGRSGRNAELDGERTHGRSPGPHRAVRPAARRMAARLQERAFERHETERTCQQPRGRHDGASRATPGAGVRSMEDGLPAGARRDVQRRIPGHNGRAGGRAQGAVPLASRPDRHEVLRMETHADAGRGDGGVPVRHAEHTATGDAVNGNLRGHSPGLGDDAPSRRLHLEAVPASRGTNRSADSGNGETNQPVRGNAAMKDWWRQRTKRLQERRSATAGQPRPEAEKETLTLPPAAGAFWEKIREATGKQLNAPAGSGEKRRCYELGGGSILAARWQHRESYDIDLTTTDPNGAIAETIATKGGLASATHGVLRPQSNMHRAVISTREGTLDVTKMRPRRDGEQRTSIVNGRPETVLTTAQIIEGKLARAQEAIPRDVYDVRAAQELDAHSLEQACGNLAPREAEAIATLWSTQNKRLEAEARETIRTLDGQLPRNLKDLGLHGAQAIQEFWHRSRGKEQRESAERGRPIGPPANPAQSHETATRTDPQEPERARRQKLPLRRDNAGTE